MTFYNYNKVFIIAEAGVNHNGDPEIAKRLIDAAAEAGADAVKFQTFKPGECTGRFAFKVQYQDNPGEAETRYQQSSRLALPFDVFIGLQEHCRKRGIMFISTPDGKASLEFLTDRLRVPMIKIASTEMTNLEFLKLVGMKNLPIILSTGMSTLEEVDTAVQIIRSVNSKELALLHCTTEYPAPYDEINLKAIQTLKERFKLPAGFSDHSIGSEAAVAAVALGAEIIEKHFTLDRNLPGPDHKASMEPAELKSLVQSIRIAERVLGDGVKKPTASELRNMPGVRRGIVAASALKKGTVLTKDMLTFKRPNIGIPPDAIDRVLGKTLIKDLEEDEVLQWDYLT